MVIAICIWYIFYIKIHIMRLYDESPGLLRSWITTAYIDSLYPPTGRARTTPSMPSMIDTGTLTGTPRRGTHHGTSQRPGPSTHR